MSPPEVREAFKQLSLYTNAESCPMVCTVHPYTTLPLQNLTINQNKKCASAIRWTALKEYIYGTSIKTLTEKGWSQIHISSQQVFGASTDLPSHTRLVGGVLANETDPYFSWQFDGRFPCPGGCRRSDAGDRNGNGGMCVKV